MNVAVSRDNLTAAVLALGVHVFFLLLLVLGVSWQMQHPQPIVAELWQSMPPVSKPPPAPAESKPKSDTSEPPESAAENKNADIALEKKKQEEKQKQQELAKQALEKKREEARMMELEAEREAARLEADKLKKQQKLAEQKRLEALRQEEAELERSMLEESLARDAALAKARGAKAAVDKRAAEINKIVDLYKSKISDKIHGNNRMLENITGNPEVVFEISVLPTGQITGIKTIKPSGNALWDEMAKRAIEKSDPLPLPPNRDAMDKFRPSFRLRMNPRNSSVISEN